MRSVEFRWISIPVIKKITTPGMHSSFLVPPASHLEYPVVAAGRARRLQGVEGIEPLLQACPVVVGPAGSPAPDQEAVIVVRAGKFFVYIHSTLAPFKYRVSEVKRAYRPVPPIRHPHRRPFAHRRTCRSAYSHPNTGEDKFRSRHPQGEA